MVVPTPRRNTIHMLIAIKFNDLASFFNIPVHDFISINKRFV